MKLKKKSNLIHDFIVGIGAILTLVIPMYFSTAIAAALVICVGVIMLLAMGRKRHLLLLWLIFSITGSVAEMFAIKSGLWTYATIDLVSIPWYLPPVWGNAALFIINTYVFFQKKK
jgi:hypothetical protein